MSRPESATGITQPLAGLSGFFMMAFLLRTLSLEMSLTTQFLVLVFSYAGPILIYDFSTKSFPDIIKSLNSNKKTSHKRVWIRLLGLYAIFLLIGLIYFIFPEYQGEFYSPFYEFLKLAFPFIIIFSIPYFYLMDLYLTDPKDSYWKFGRFLIGQHEFTKDILQLLLGWLVKAFFLPLMLIYFSKNINFLMTFDSKIIFRSFRETFDFLLSFIFMLDVLCAVAGYLCTFRIFDSHIRSTEPTLTGWFCALICYQPFWSFFSKNYFAYSSEKSWGYWFQGSAWYPIWGTIILLFFLIYLWANLSFGVRFSNLTHRGIITSGPYRFTKHPAYISKNLAWWMISMPFMVSGSVAQSFKCCFMLMLLNGIYFLRAKTEERHLSADPVYRTYAHYIRENGLFRRLPKILPNHSFPWILT